MCSDFISLCIQIKLLLLRKLEYGKYNSIREKEQTTVYTHDCI